MEDRSNEPTMMLVVSVNGEEVPEGTSLLDALTQLMPDEMEVDMPDEGEPMTATEAAQRTQSLSELLYGDACPPEFMGLAGAADKPSFTNGHETCVDYTMETVLSHDANAGVSALAGRSFNTIRRFNEKYASMIPGDLVRMNYTYGGEVVGYEVLEVASIAGADDLGRLLNAHGEYNHSAKVRAGFGGAFEVFEDIYGSLEGDWVAIYFK